MKKLANFELTSSFEDKKEELHNYDFYAALTLDDRLVHLKEEYPDLVDIALWDNTNEEILMIRGYEYTAKKYPTDRYTPIGVEVIPKSHMDDGHARIMSLKLMSADSPINGTNEIEAQNIYGLYDSHIDNIEFKTYVPYIADNSQNFGNIEEIKGWENIDAYNVEFLLPSDVKNSNYIVYPFNDKYSYYYNEYQDSRFLPCMYDINMGKNPIFFTENQNAENPSCLLNFDGKGETAKILNQLAVNLGNEDWKTRTTIPSYTSETLGWDKIAPPIQSSWMYCIDEKYKDNPIFGQGQWYVPTIGEVAYIGCRYMAIMMTIFQIYQVQNDLVAIQQSLLGSSSQISDSLLIGLNIQMCSIGTYNRHNGIPIRAFCLI